MFQNKCSLKSHMDSIRGLHFIPSINALVSASEDCTVKVWDTSKFSNFKDIESVPLFEPYLTFRGHFDPIFTLAGRMNAGFNQNFMD
jgi:WD40 repeat protein